MTALWVLAAFFYYCAGALSERTNGLFVYWRAVKRTRNIQSQARREAASRAITGFILFLLSALAALGLSVAAWWFQ